MFRTVELQSDGSVQVARGLALVSPPPAGAVRWIDLTDPTDALLALLGERFGFQALTLESCAHIHPHAKVELHEDHLFVATCGFAAPTLVAGAMRWHELHAFLAHTYLVTVHLREIPALDFVWERVEEGPELLRHGPDFVYYLLARGLASDCVHAATHMSDELDRIARTSSRSPSPVLEAVTRLQSQLAELRDVVAPQRECMADLSLKSERWLSQQTRFHLRELQNLLAWMTDALDADCERWVEVDSTPS